MKHKQDTNEKELAIEWINQRVSGINPIVSFDHRRVLDGLAITIVKLNLLKRSDVSPIYPHKILC